jgi:uncharacterized protein (TIGR02246 family)
MPSQNIGPAEDVAEIERIRAAVVKAEKDGDAQALAALFADDISMLPTGNQIHGAEGVEEFHRQLYEQADFDAVFTIDRIIVLGDLAMENGTYLVETASQEDGSQGRVEGRYLYRSGSEAGSRKPGRQTLSEQPYQPLHRLLRQHQLHLLLPVSSLAPLASAGDPSLEVGDGERVGRGCGRVGLGMGGGGVGRGLLVLNYEESTLRLHPRRVLPLEPSGVQLTGFSPSRRSSRPSVVLSRGTQSSTPSMTSNACRAHRKPSGVAKTAPLPQWSQALRGEEEDVSPGCWERAVI